MAFQTDTVHQHEVSSRRTVPRNNSSMKSCLLVVGGVTNGDGKWTNYNHCHYHDVFDVARGNWSTVSDTPGMCSLGAAVTLNESIYVVGGDNRKCLNTTRPRTFGKY
ncbi:hypothetical protein NP493_4396g00002 [Ridgeia piscesae]|uniref:Uncharacterized protein n=1 Tax=Ridgeia piscesae TaxID=27915 RepID=A0AAD9IZK1_RIDPI|nr:hypothetical protein NP493_4396g00002 [Ridgeia piscesae]